MDSRFIIPISSRNRFCNLTILIFYGVEDVFDITKNTKGLIKIMKIHTKFHKTYLLLRTIKMGQKLTIPVASYKVNINCNFRWTIYVDISRNKETITEKCSV